jgi:hypothetical protein
LFKGFLSVAPACDNCGLDFSFADAGDGPAVFVTLFAGFLVLGMALWVETMDRDLPFGFLDHKLKVGNALVGAWFDSYRDYPIPRFYKGAKGTDSRGRARAGEEKRGIGNRGDQGSHRLPIMMAKRRHYGYKLSKKLGILEFTNGLVANKLGLKEGLASVGRGGYAKAMPKVELFNPLMASNQQRRDRCDHKGKTYAFNALGGDAESLQTYGREVVDIIGKGWLPQRIRELTIELRQALKARK